VFNHKSNLDGVVMVKLLIQNFKENNNNFKFNIIIKKQISKVSFLYNILSLIDALYIDRDDLRQQLNLFKKQNELIKEKHSIVIAPEGTRINEDEFGEFKSGAFKIAFDNMICVQPVVI
jgi:1-acyl-sn-glycerol-3-phosphate acyltransferase